MVMVKEEMRKGPWTEQEDMQLVCFVGLFGERRWDFIAKVSGLNRSGKSCRLRWVNYLHPGLKRSRMTPQEERLILELQSRWGNRWSRIARKLPGRTDNEIKNYWRTHMRKKAQELKRKKNSLKLPTSSASSSLLSSLTSQTSEPASEVAVESHENKSSGGCSSSMTCTGFEEDSDGVMSYSMDQIWKDIASFEGINDTSTEGRRNNYANFEVCDSTCCLSEHPALVWESYDCCDPSWKIEEELRMWLQNTEQ